MNDNNNISSFEEGDPFLQVQADVLTTLQTTRPLFSSYLRIRSLATSPSNPELQQARSELQSMLPDLTADLRDLVETVRVIEHDPYRYGLELDEVERRRKLVEDVGLEIENMRDELGKTVTTVTTTTTAAAAAASSSIGTTAGAGGAAGRGAASGLPNPSDFDALLSPDATADDARGGDDDYYSSYEQQRQVELMQAQDQQLDGVLRTVGNLRQQANDMGRELEDQAVMLDDVDTLADRVGGKLQNGVKKIRQIVRKNEGEIFVSKFHVFACSQLHRGMKAYQAHAISARYHVIVLHRSSHLCSDTATDLGDCPII
ncbi:hypothetical protein Egran_01780 [Elaphomyces granulatus]|uniref:t-SNARE affecting a late Golgi compartment protein 1 n=1 Tax=Elaphomyces granulatus TaxID=519963 RepID=A0A232M242_9EURO|nr:hypothetical protein Egran_01780 [Elaphomyces granulatus]